uniref:Chorein N-terminal domain-containing protein n=1 Tax=Romanomermis culicivorax TaxID=13658 RepID=A0A915HM71_ROMCU
DNLDLPIKLKSGYLNKLVLKVPWKNLYNEPVIAEIDGLYILAVPNLGIKYDAVKEEKQAQDTKQAELSRIEEARKAKKKEAEKAKTPEQKAQEDSFTEKMVTQVIKNLQITIKNIHIRYEDQFTNRKRPFALGFTLGRLFFQTTDANWTPTIIKDVAAKLFYKLIDLDSLSFYWNSNCNLMSNLESRDEMRDAMIKLIATKSYAPKEISYILAPISISAKLQLNQKPEADSTNFRTPKVFLTLDIERLEMNLGKFQYQDILEFLEAQERLTLNAKYRKYRPNLKEYKKHAKEWWHFAYACILEENIRRRRRNWSWTNIKNHRKLVRDYKEAYIQNLTNKTPAPEILALVQKAEKNLNTFNLNVARQQAEFEIDRRGLTRIEDQQGWVGWVASFWGGSGGGSKTSTKKEDDITSQFEKAMTPEEREKLYAALDYNENQTPAMYPKEFIENLIHFSLNQLVVRVQENQNDTSFLDVLSLNLCKVSAVVEQRPSAQAIKVTAKMQTLTIDGVNEAGKRPPIILSADAKALTADNPQLFFLFESNPLDASFDQMVKLHALPLDVRYHAPSINKLADVFKPPESVKLKQLTAAAFAKYDDIKSRSATGLSYALEKHTRLKLDIEIMPTCIQIYEGGIFDEACNVLVLDLGCLKVSTLDSGSIKSNEAFFKKDE